MGENASMATDILGVRSVRRDSFLVAQRHDSGHEIATVSSPRLSLSCNYLDTYNNRPLNDVKFFFVSAHNLKWGTNINSQIQIFSQNESFFFCLVKCAYPTRVKKFLRGLNIVVILLLLFAQFCIMNNASFNEIKVFFPPPSQKKRTRERWTCK